MSKKVTVFFVQPRNWEYNDQNYDYCGTEPPVRAFLTRKAAEEFAEVEELFAWKRQFTTNGKLHLEDIVRFTESVEISEEGVVHAVRATGISIDDPEEVTERVVGPLSDNQWLSLIRNLHSLRFFEVSETEMVGIDPHEFLTAAADAVGDDR